QVLGADNRVGGRHLLAPDALVILTGPGTRDVVLLEYEQAATAPRIAHKIEGLLQYYRLQPWRRPGATLTTPPKVLWSVGRTADRRRYWRSPLEEVRRQAGPEPFLYDRLWLVAEEDWRAGRWALQSVRPGDERAHPLRARLLTTPLSPA
ncbi:MAG: hypothetical protein OWV35_08185, partial [Firmicutes bacterium]|nr:hypothetical protein [Bacillota bacterium]